MLFKKSNKWGYKILFNYDYSKTMMMKLLLAKPDLKGGSFVWYNFEEALEIIKHIDIMTLGAPKIIYLVGWQYFGHDDKYPAFFEVNDALKRKEDKSARDSLLWLVEEAKKHHTVVSYHINLSDAYVDSPLWQEYLENDLILKHNCGRLKVTGKWYGRNAYQVKFGKEFESGYFQKRVDKLLELLPIQEAKTVHVDAFFVRKGKGTTIADEKIARQKMIKYFGEKGVDVTSEFIYREKKNGFRSHVGYSDVIGIIPAFWQVVLSQKDIMKYSAREVAGGRQCNFLSRDKKLEWLYYGNIFAEETIKAGKGWQEVFLKEFVCYNVPYLYLNQHSRQSISGRNSNRICNYSEDIHTHIKNKMIVQNGDILKFNNDLCLPIWWKKNCFIAFSESGGDKTFNVCSDNVNFESSVKMSNNVSFDNAKVFKLDCNGLQLLQEIAVNNESDKNVVNEKKSINQTVTFNTLPNCAYVIEMTNK